MDAKEIVDALLRLAEILISWPMVVLLLVYFLRRQLGELLERIKMADLRDYKLEFLEPKTISTNLGETEYSGAVAPMISGGIVFEGFLGTYVNMRYNFQISWPSESWSSLREDERRVLVDSSHELKGFSEDQKKDFRQFLEGTPNVDIPVIIRRNEGVRGFVPNVLVTVRPVGYMHISQYYDYIKKEHLSQGWDVESSRIDDETNGGFLVLVNGNLNVYQYCRLAIAFGKGYLVLASQLPPNSQLDQEVKQELLSILNSFRIFTIPHKPR